MDELLEFCARMLGDPRAAAGAAEQARQDGSADRVQDLARAVEACRQVSDSTSAHNSDSTSPPSSGADGARRSDAAPASDSGVISIVDAVAGELKVASAGLPQRQREALALRESLRLSYAEIAEVIGIEPVAVAPLLARARLRLQRELRGSAGPATEDCPERDRALRTIALRQDHESVLPVDDDWLLDHVGHCAGCGQAHGAMLEASVRYRAWRLTPAPAPAAPDGGAPASASGER